MLASEGSVALEPYLNRIAFKRFMRSSLLPTPSNAIVSFLAFSRSISCWSLSIPSSFFAVIPANVDRIMSLSRLGFFFGALSSSEEDSESGSQRNGFETPACWIANVSDVWPILTQSPGRSGTLPLAKQPFTNVPREEPRST